MKLLSVAGTLALAAVAVLAVGAGASRESQFTTIDVPGAVATRAFGINPAGDIVGSYTDAAGKTRGFVLADGQLTTIDVPGAVSTAAWGINPAGDIIGRYGTSDGRTHGFLLRDGELSTVDAPGNHLHTLPIKITPDGTIVGCYHDTDFMKDMFGFVLGNGEFTTYPLIASMHNGAARRQGSRARRSLGRRTGRSGGELVVGLYFETATKTHGYAIDGGEYMAIDFPNAAQTSAWDVNPRGEIVGRYSDGAGRTHGFLFADGDYASIDVPGARSTEAYGISATGDIVGWYVDAAGRPHGFMLDR